METSNVVIASDDNELTEILCRVCHTAGLGTISSQQTQLAPVLMESGRPLVLCVDARLESKPNWPLYHDIADSKDLRRIPMILILQPGQRLSYQFPKDHCVYTIVAGERLSSTFAIVLEELVDVARTVSDELPRQNGRGGSAKQSSSGALDKTE